MDNFLAKVSRHLTTSRTSKVALTFTASPGKEAFQADTVLLWTREFDFREVLRCEVRHAQAIDLGWSFMRLARHRYCKRLG